jgi:hypothetical protein
MAAAYSFMTTVVLSFKVHVSSPPASSAQLDHLRE